MPEETPNQPTNVTGDGNVVADQIDVGGDMHIDNSRPENITNIAGHNFANAQFGGDFVAGDKVLGNKIIQNFLGGKPIAPEEIPVLLRKASLAYFQHLTGPGGRFAHLSKQNKEGEFEALGWVAEHILTAPLLDEKKENSDLMADRGLLNYGTPDPGYGGRGLPPAVEEVDYQHEKSTLYYLDNLWKEGYQGDVHTLLLGEAGMGKTVNLVWVWKQYLEREDTPIPIYLSLNEYNNVAAHERPEFIIQSILQKYLGERRKDSELEQVLWDWLQGHWPEDYPKVLLLLDGWNEITVDKSAILADLSDNWLQLVQGVQIVVSSRENLQSNVSAFASFKVLTLQPLSDNCIRLYLQSEHSPKPVPEDPGMKRLLSNPMMLSLYADTEAPSSTDSRFQFQLQETTGGEFQFQLQETTGGELIWNFVETKMHKLFETAAGETGELAFYHFLNKHILPFVGFEMERQGLYEVEEADLETMVNQAFHRFDQADYFSHFRRYRPHIRTYRKYVQSLRLGQLPWQEEIERFEEVTEHLRSEIFPFSQENGRYHFLHQSFRDFYAAIFVYDAIRLSLEKGEIPAVLKEAPLSPILRKMLGEIEGEQYNKPRWNAVTGKWSSAHYRDTIFSYALQLCWGVFDRPTTGFTVYNILEIWKEVRGELSGADLSYLDLEQTEFRGVVCGRQSEATALSADWEGARLSPRQFFPQGHRAGITTACFSPDGQYLLSAGRETCIRLWSLGSNQWVHNFSGHQNWVIKLAFKPDTQQFLSLSIDKTIKLWSVDNSECLLTFPAPDIRCFNPTADRIGPEFQQIALDYTEQVVLFSNPQGDIVYAFQSTPGAADQPVYVRVGQNIAFSPDGEQLAYLQHDEVVFWSIRQGAEIDRLKLPSAGMDVLTFSSDGCHLAVAGAGDGNITWWSLDEGTLLHTFKGHRGTVKALDFCGRKKRLVSTGADATIRIWSLRSEDWGSEKEEVQNFSQKLESTRNFHAQAKGSLPSAPDQWKQVRISPCGQFVAVGSSNRLIKILSVDTGACLHQLRAHRHFLPIQTLAFDAASKRLVSGSEDKDLRVWLVETGENLSTFRGQENSTSVLVSSPNLVISAAGDNDIKVWRQQPDQEGTGWLNCRQIMQGHQDWITGLALSPDGKLLASASYDHTLKLWHLDTGKCLWTQSAHRGLVTALAFHPEGKLIATGSEEIRFWSVEDGEQKGEKIKQAKLNALRNLCFMPDGRLISAGKSPGIQCWIPDEQGNYKPAPDSPLQNALPEVLDIALSPNGQYLAHLLPQKPVQIWDLDQQPTKHMQLPGGAVSDAYCLAFSPDSSLLAHGFNEKGQQLIRVWEVEEQKVRYILQGHSGKISTLVFSANGRYLISGALDNNIRVWDMDNGKGVQNIPNIHLGVQGCDFTGVQWLEEPSEQEKDLFVLYGARPVFDDIT